MMTEWARVLDKLYLRGLSQIFLVIAMAAAQKFNVSLGTVHLDSSSFHVHGEYESKIPEVSLVTKKLPSDDRSESVMNEKIVPLPISITYGYSRDHRPDLKQFILDLICSGDGDVPLFLRVADGDESDSAVFAQILCDFKKQLNLDALMVADSALYTAPNLALMENLKWLSRVPLTIKQAKQLISQLTESDFVDSEMPGYRWSEHNSKYGGIQQRWLVVESDVRRQSDQRRLEKNLEKFVREANQQLRELSTQNFACQPDAYSATEKLSRKLKYHNLTNIQIIEVFSDKASSPLYKIQASLEPDSSVIAAENRQAGRFILATNVLDVQELSNDQMLFHYKEQQSSERGFGFLKDPLFFTDSVFLKSPERIESLAFVMGLCLLVYTLGQRHLRHTLNQSKLGIKNQLGKLTESPTLRWIFQCFQAVHLLLINGVKQISNLTEERLRILGFLPNACRYYYLLSCERLL